jgi:hypothetical protein
MAYASIDLRLEFEVVNSELETLEPNDEGWEESQDACIEAAMKRLENSLVALDFVTSIERD